jgi:hypothetical protein
VTDQAWDIGEDNPQNEGSDTTAVGPGSVGEQRAAEHSTARDGAGPGDTDRPPAYDPDREHEPQAGVQGGAARAALERSSSARAAAGRPRSPSRSG